ncbi:hypothetical protein GCM10011369_08820 [Neiella marina]|uniref:Uncharacterized protein n=1 Tax=Neiella marina TaxID=508461 RepID=A0A8J2U305_9GAMM|nr:hypothetical protein [Neiella marina]GGA69391.1 hypothetical protein GCM10011369_08820 [Neiella marina]
MSGFIEILGYLKNTKRTQIAAAQEVKSSSVPSTKASYFRYATERTDD